MGCSENLCFNSLYTCSSKLPGAGILTKVFEVGIDWFDSVFINVYTDRDPAGLIDEDNGSEDEDVETIAAEFVPFRTIS